MSIFHFDEFEKEYISDNPHLNSKKPPSILLATTDMMLPNSLIGFLSVTIDYLNDLER